MALAGVLIHTDGLWPIPRRLHKASRQVLRIRGAGLELTVILLDALAGPFETIPIPAFCHSMDYEVSHNAHTGRFTRRLRMILTVILQAELCLVIGKDCKNLHPQDDITEYILGYTAGNDISSRYWQAPERSGNQHGSAKSFDKFAPIGPVITSARTIPNLADLRLECFVNGSKRQSSKLDDLIFDVAAVLAHLSRGMTIRRGTVVMTGTPSGVAAFMKPPQWLKDGDVVEVSLEHVGTIRNRFSFEDAS